MKFTRPAWVTHSDDSGPSNPYSLGSAPPANGTQKKALSIFSISVHPDDSRIATGGLDTNVRIWATAPILNEGIEIAMNEGNVGGGKLLATLGMHAGPVLCVRWSASGRWLASGSDDSVVLVWDLDPTPARSRGGFALVEERKISRTGNRSSDSPDTIATSWGLDWSPGDRYLASIGLDSMVIVWDGRTLGLWSFDCTKVAFVHASVFTERIQQLKHDNFVKGVCWDPAGEFLASCSDDKSVKVWRRHANSIGVCICHISTPILS